jgi:hypothetical protein
VERRARLSPVWLAGAALGGTWVGHTIEYSRLSGVHAAFASIHVYMGPVGAVLAGMAVIGMWSTARLASRLEHRLAELRHGAAAGRAPILSGWSLGFPALLALLWVWQVALYYLQENLEALWRNLPAPGMAALTGAHAWASVIHLGVATVLAGAVWLSRRRVTELADAVQLEELARCWVVVPQPPTPTFTRTWTPSERWGKQLWSRPPPALAGRS